MLPNLQNLEQIRQQIKHVPNKRKESKRKEHYGLFLLCYEAGLRVSEAINFNLSNKTKKGLFRITKTKGKKERLVYIPQQVIKELKKHDWKPQKTNRFNFYHFLKKIRRELNISKNIELTPHTLRRAFATYHAENGLPLPLLQKLLGHQSIRTTALYWLNIYNENDNDTDDILTAKFWPKKLRWKPKLESEVPVNLNLGDSTELSVLNSLASEPSPNYLSNIKHLEGKLSQIQNKKDEKINQLIREKETLQQNLTELSGQNSTLCQEKAKLFIQKSQIITEREQIQQELTTAKQTITSLQEQLFQERKNSAQQKQTINNLRQQLQIERKINADLTQKNHSDEQNYINLQNVYQNALNDKELAQKQLTQLTAEIKKLARTLAQWQKLHYYQQLEQERNQTEAKIIQTERPPPWKNK